MMSNHFHFLVEARDNEALARGMQGLSIGIAKALNRKWRRRGKVFLERFFARALLTGHAMRGALIHVLQNARRNGLRLPADRPDPFPSAAWYRRWHGRPPERRDPSPVVPPRRPTFEVILMQGLGLDQVPGTHGFC